MVASYLLSNTLLPILAVWLLKPTHKANGGTFLGGILPRYEAFLEWSIDHWSITLGLYAAFCLVAAVMLLGLGAQLFPDVDTGQFQLRFPFPCWATRSEEAAPTRDADAVFARFRTP